MTEVRGTAVAIGLCALAAAGCGVGEGESRGEIELTITRDYGSELISRQSEEASESDTVLRLLDRQVEVETRYGGGFVQSIQGLSGTTEDGRRLDWFFYVNGIESPLGSAEYEPEDGDRIWWDYRDWTDAMRVPAVVGSYPEPFLHGFEGVRWESVVDCVGRIGTCEVVRAKLEDAGVSQVGIAEGSDSIRVLVGPWDRIASDPVARLLRESPQRSGVFARFEEGGVPILVLLDYKGRERVRCTGVGLTAALRPDEGPPTWVVTGTDTFGVALAASSIGPGLRDRYAAARVPGKTGFISLPIAGAGQVVSSPGCREVGS